MPYRPTQYLIAFGRKLITIIPALLFFGILSLKAQSTFEISFKGKIYSDENSLGLKTVTHIYLYTQDGAFVEDYYFRNRKFKMNLDVGEEYVFFIARDGHEIKAVSYSTVFSNSEALDGWINCKANFFLKAKDPVDKSRARSNESEMITIQRFQWDENSRLYQSASIGLPRKYHNEYKYFIKNEKFGDVSILISKLIKQYVNLELTDDEPSTTNNDTYNNNETYKEKEAQPVYQQERQPERESVAIEAQSSQYDLDELQSIYDLSSSNLENLKLKRDLLRLEIDAMELKVYFLDDKALKAISKKSLDDIRQLLELTNKKISEEESRVEKMESTLAELRKKQIDQPKSVNTREEVNRLPAPQYQKKTVKLKDKAGKEMEFEKEGSRADNSGNRVEIYAPKQATEKIRKIDECDNYNRMNGANKVENIEINDSISTIIQKLSRNNEPNDEYSFFTDDKEIIVRKYVLKEGIFEVIMDADCQVQLLRNNALVTNPVFTKEVSEYHRKLTPLNEIQLKGYHLSFIKKKSVEGLFFRVQIGATKNPDIQYYRRLVKLKEIEEEYYAGWYNYYIGQCNTITEILRYQEIIRNTVPDAYTVAFYFGKRVKLNYAYSLLSSL